MPQDNRDDNKLPRFGNKRLPDDPNQAPIKGPRFSIYWIYAIIFAVLIGFQLFGPFSPNMAKTNSLDFKRLIATGEVQKYIIVDNRKTVKIYLNKAGVDNHRDELKKGVTGKINEEGPHMYFKITGGEAFQKDMSDFYKANPNIKEVPSDVENERDWFGGALQFSTASAPTGSVEWPGLLAACRENGTSDCGDSRSDRLAVGGRLSGHRPVGWFLWRMDIIDAKNGWRCRWRWWSRWYF